MKRVAWFTLVSLATIAGAWFVWELRTVVGLFLLSLAVSAAVRPLAGWLSAHGFPPGLALLSVYAGFIGSLVGLVLLFSGPFFADLQQLASDLVSSYEAIKTQWPQGTVFQQFIVQLLAAPDDLFQAIVGEQGGALLQTFLGMTLTSFDLLGQIVIILVLSIYWSADQEHFKRLWLSLLPAEVRARAREAWQNIESGIGAYIRSEFVQSLLAMVLLAAGYYLIGLKYPVALGVIGALGWLLPWVGVLLAVVPVLLVGLAVSPALGVGGALLTLAVLSFLEFIIEPRFFNRRRFSPLLAVTMVLVLADQFGLIGLILAPPLAAVIQITAGQLIRSATVTTLVTTQPLSQLDALQERLAAVQDLVAQQTTPPAPEIVNLLDRLQQLIERAQKVEEPIEAEEAARTKPALWRRSSVV